MVTSIRAKIYSDVSGFFADGPASGREWSRDTSITEFSQTVKYATIDLVSCVAAYIEVVTQHW